MRKSKMTKLFLLISMTLISYGCTDATLSQLTSLNSPGIIECYSGGHLIYRGESTGKILTEKSSDGWYLRDKSTNRLVMVSGDCIIRN